MEKDLEILEEFRNNHLQRDKFEIDNRCGGFKMGKIYKLTELNPALEHLIQAYKEQQVELKKKDKIIDELEHIFDNYQLCEYEITDCTYRKCEYIADDEKPPCRECIKQYLEREVEDVK